MSSSNPKDYILSLSGFYLENVVTVSKTKQFVWKTCLCIWKFSFTNHRFCFFIIWHINLRGILECIHYYWIIIIICVWFMDILFWFRMMHWVQMHKIRTSRFLLDRPEPGDDRRRGEGVLQHDGGWGDLRLPGRARQQDAQYTLEEESAGKLLVLTLRKPWIWKFTKKSFFSLWPGPYPTPPPSLSGRPLKKELFLRLP